MCIRDSISPRRWFYPGILDICFSVVTSCSRHFTQLVAYTHNISQHALQLIGYTQRPPPSCSELILLLRAASWPDNHETYYRIGERENAVITCLEPTKHSQKPKQLQEHFVQVITLFIWPMYRRNNQVYKEINVFLNICFIILCYICIVNELKFVNFI